MAKPQAIIDLEKQIKQIANLRQGSAFSAEHTKWVSDTLYLVEETFGQASRIYISLANISWSPSGSFVADVFSMEQVLAAKRKQAYSSYLDTAKGILESGIEQIKRKGVENVYEGKDTEVESSEILRIIALIDTKLRKLIRTKPNKETEVQDALENLFIAGGFDSKFTRDKENVVYSSKTYYPDFVFTKQDLVVEAKLCDDGKREKAMIAEINDDILAYKAKYTNLIFVIYDLGNIRDQELFKTSLEANDQVVVKIIKH